MAMPKYLLQDEEPELLGDLTQGTSQQMAPAPIPQQQTLVKAPPPMAPPPMNSVPALPPQAPAAPPVKLPGMPDGISPQDFEGYLSAQKKSLDTFGPEAQMGLQKGIDNRRNSLGYKATEGLKGFADALMMGVAGAGNPNWQGQFTQQENQMANEQMNTLKAADEGNLRRTSTNMNIDRMNPQSALSKSLQDSYAPLFEKLGYPPEALARMSAANLESAMALMAQFGGKQVEAMIKKYEAEVAGAQFEETKRHNRAVEGSQEADDKRSAASELLKRGADNKTVAGIPIPFTRANDDSTKAAKKVLMGELGEGSTEFIKTATNPKTGEKMGTRDGKTWEKINK